MTGVDYEEASLFARRNDPDARRMIVEQYDYLAQQLARKFSGRGSEFDDLVQVARFGLLNAIDRFDVDRGIRFSTFAGRTIIGEIKHHFRSNAWALRVPRSMQNLWLRSGQAMQHLEQQLGRAPTVAELAGYLDVEADEVLDALEAGGSMRAASLDQPVGDEGAAALGELIGDIDPDFERAERWTELQQIAESLDERERMILYLRFFEGRTQREIGEVAGVSQVHVSRIIRQALDRIRKDMDADPS